MFHVDSKRMHILLRWMKSGINVRRKKILKTLKNKNMLIKNLVWWCRWGLFCSCLFVSLITEREWLNSPPIVADSLLPLRCVSSCLFWSLALAAHMQGLWHPGSVDRSVALQCPAFPWRCSFPEASFVWNGHSYCGFLSSGVHVAQPPVLLLLTTLVIIFKGGLV